MLTLQEREKLKKIMEIFSGSTAEKKIDVFQRSRDEMGRFQSERKEELEFVSDRKINW